MLLLIIEGHIPLLLVLWGMNQMLLQNVSVLHYSDSLTICNPLEVPSPDLAADAVQTC